MTRAIARIWLVLWGLPQTVVGLVMCCALHRGGPHRQFSYRAAIVTEWRLQSGLSLGMFVFAPQGCPQSLLAHEYGHTLQSMLLGPLYLPVIVVPSLVWAGMPTLDRMRARRGYSYYRFYTERWANLLVRRVTGVEPEGWYPTRRHR